MHGGGVAIGSMSARLRELPGLRLTLFLLLLVAAVNALGVWQILAARRAALETARTELALETAAHARSLEAVLAVLRGDLVFLSQSPPLVRYLETAGSDDPLVRRWSRLDVEGSLLLFLQAHPAVRRLEVRDAAGGTRVAAARQGGAPTVVPPEAPGFPPADEDPLWQGFFPLGSSGSEVGRLAVRVDPDGLLAIAAPRLAPHLELERPGAPQPAKAGADRALVARADFSEERWTPPIHGTLVRSETQSLLVSSVESLAGRYWTTVLLSSLVMTLTLVLGTVALRQGRRAAQLAAARRHEAQVRELERQLFHSERLASLGRLAAGMAHEINNPLEGIANYLSLLDEDLRAGRTGDVGRQVARIRQGLDRAAGAVRQVLAFADPGRTPRRRIDLSAVLAEALEFVRAAPAFEGLEVRLDVPGEPLAVEGDRVTLGQLFLNLLLNACQVQAGRGGEVEVKARADGERVRVVIADRGPGLPAELGGRIFEPFVSTRDSSGLGLAVCHGIVRDHGGTIVARDREGGGAELEVTLPAAAAPDEPDEMEEAGAGEQRSSPAPALGGRES